MKLYSISKQVSGFVIICLSIATVSLARPSKFEEISHKLQFGTWQEKGQAAKELSKMGGVA